MFIRVIALVFALGCSFTSPLRASPEHPGRIVAVDAGHLFFENGDVYALQYAPTLSLTYMGNVYRTLGLAAGAVVGATSGVSPGVSQGGGAGISPAPSSVAQRCAAITRKGTQCSRRAQAASAYCWQHQR